MPRRVRRSYKYRWYPTDEQAAELARTFGCVRLVYNLLPPAIHTDTGDANVVGLDAGLTTLVTLSTGEKLANPRYECRDQQRLTKAQRGLARKQRGSRNRERARAKLARVHARISDRRRDHLHQLTTRLVRENQAVVIEDLNVRGMTANHKSTSAPGMGVTWSWWTAGCHRARHVRRAGASLRRCRSRCAHGPARRVLASTTGTSTPQRTFWPPGWRLLPVELAEDLNGSSERGGR
jgi:transposase